MLAVIKIAFDVTPGPAVCSNLSTRTSIALAQRHTSFTNGHRTGRGRFDCPGLEPRGDVIPETIVGVRLALANLRAVYADQRRSLKQRDI